MSDTEMSLQEQLENEIKREYEKATNERRRDRWRRYACALSSDHSMSEAQAAASADIMCRLEDERFGEIE